MTVGMDRGEIAEVGSPVLVPADPVDAVHPWRWTTGVIAVATLFLALTNAAAIGGWYDELTPTPLTERLRAPIDQWRQATAGLDAPRSALRAQWQRARGARFGSEHPEEQGAADAP